MKLPVDILKPPSLRTMLFFNASLVSWQIPLNLVSLDRSCYSWSNSWSNSGCLTLQEFPGRPESIESVR